jgi:hypothetical protein
LNSTSVTIQGVTSKDGVSTKSGKPYTKFTIDTSGGTFGTFDTALAQTARNAINMTCAVTYEETQYGKDLKSLTADASIPAAAPHVEPVRHQQADGSADWDMIGLRKTRCALWVAAIHAGLDAGTARQIVLEAEVDIFWRQPATESSAVPF